MYLDVDGVLSPIRPLGNPFGDQVRCDDPVTQGIFIRSKTLGNRLGKLLDEVDDFVWLTTWSHDAKRHVEPLLQFRPGRVLEPFSTPSDSWWKWEHVARECSSQPEPFVWIDDELQGHITLLQNIRHWAESLSVAHCFVTPDPAYGLTPDQLADIHAFLSEHRNLRASPHNALSQQTWPVSRDKPPPDTMQTTSS